VERGLSVWVKPSVECLCGPGAIPSTEKEGRGGEGKRKKKREPLSAVTGVHPRTEGLSLETTESPERQFLTLPLSAS
jgi:hypothetical protein